MRCYVNITEWQAFTAEKELVLLEIMRVVQSLGLSIAFPSRSLYIENLGSNLNLSEQPLAQQAEADENQVNAAAEAGATPADLPEANK